MLRELSVCMTIAAVMGSCAMGQKSSDTDLSTQNDSVDVELSDEGDLTMNSTWDYYPVSAATISVTLHSASMSALTDNGYKFAIIDESTRKVVGNHFDPIYSKITNDTGGYGQIVELRLKEKLIAGKYCVKFSHGDSDTLTAAFEVVSSKGVMTVMDRIGDYFSDKNKLRNDTVACNVYMFGIVSDDSIEVALRHDSQRMRKLFCRDVVSYSALKFSGQVNPHVYKGPVVTDTLGVSMTTLEQIYPDTVSEIKFVLHNNSNKTLCYGTPYTVARHVDGKWIELFQNGVWDMPLFSLAPGGNSEVMTAKLYRPINDILPGEYVIYKDVYFAGDSGSRWNISARFSIK